MPRWIALAVAGLALACAASAEDRYASQRKALIAELSHMRPDLSVRRIDSRVLAAIEKVPRHEFVPAQMAPYAYDNRPLPIGEGQTISQPYIVALMTDLLEVRKDDRILEVGTGSGYQAAILAEMGAAVHSIEIVAPLAASARERLARLGYKDIEVITGDGYAGLPRRAPFDGIIVTAAAPHIPKPLVEQLKPGGRMVIPVGPALSLQNLMLVEKKEDGSVKTRNVLPVRFVPLTGDR